MPARIVPTIDGNPTYLEISLRYVDANGQIRSDVSLIDVNATNLQIDDLVDEYSPVSRAALYAVHITQVYGVDRASAGASPNPFVSVNDNIVYHAKDVTRQTRRAFIPSPHTDIFVPGTETPNESFGHLVNWLDAWNVLWGGTFSGRSLRFTRRRDKKGKVGL